MRFFKLFYIFLYFLTFSSFNSLIGNDFVKIDNNGAKYSFPAYTGKAIITTLSNLSKEYNITIDSIVLANPRWSFQLRLPKFPFKVYKSNSYNLGLITTNTQHNLSYHPKYYVYYTIDELHTQVIDLYNLYFEFKYNDIFDEFTYNKSGIELKNSLKQYLEGHTVLSYKEAREKMFGEIDNYDGKVECIYTGRKIEATGIPDVGQTGFNTEHTWPQAFFAKDDTAARSDIFHLYPSDETANNKRANYPFDKVTQIQWQNGGSKLGKSATGETVFEPRDESKGNIARSLFYFALRYDNPNNFLNSQEKTLREWFYNDMVDTLESARNKKIYQFQNRYNPFISHPGFLERIYSLSTDEDFPSQDKPKFSIEYAVISTDYINKKQSYNIYITNAGNTMLELTDIERIDANGGLISQLQGFLLPTTIPIDSVLKIKATLYDIPEEAKQQTKLIFTINNKKYQVILEEINPNDITEKQEDIGIYYSNNELVLPPNYKMNYQSVIVYDYLGNKVFDRSLTEINRKIPVDLAYGVYIVTLIGENTIYRSKIVVNQ